MEEKEERIKSFLRSIEERENILILYAAEKGPRAKGYLTKTSSVEVHFIYIREVDEYLSIESGKENLILSPDNQSTYKGIDIRPALKKLKDSDPYVIELFKSLIVYRSHPDFTKSIKEFLPQVYSFKKLQEHYLGRAKTMINDKYTGNQMTLRNLLESTWNLSMAKFCRYGKFPDKIELPRLGEQESNPETKEFILNVFNDALRIDSGTLVDKPLFLDQWMQLEAAHKPEFSEAKGISMQQLNEFFREALIFTH